MHTFRCFLIVAVLWASAPAAAASQAAAPDTTRRYPLAPDFEHETLTHERFRLSDQRGKVVVLNFWATWCGPCRIEIPDFIQLQKELEGEVQFVGVALDDDGAEEVRPFARRMDVNYPIIADADHSIARRYGGIVFLPTTFVIDRQGRVRHVFRGLTTRERLRPVLLKLLEKAAGERGV